MIEQEFREILASLTTLTVSLNRALETQIAPYVVVYRMGGSRGYTMLGQDKTVQSRFQVSIFAKDYKQAKTEASNLYAAADITSDNIAHISLSNEIDLYEDVTKYHHIALDFIVRHYE